MLDLYSKFKSNLYSLYYLEWVRYVLAFIAGFVLSWIVTGTGCDNKITNETDKHDHITVQDPIIDKHKIIPSIDKNVSYQSPERFITTLQKEVIKTLKSNDFSKFCSLFIKNFAFEETAKISLGKLWYTMDKNTQGEFLKLFVIYVANSYFVSVGEIIKQADNVFVQNINALASDSNIYTGKMVVVRHTEGNINVGFSLKKIDENNYKLLDFTAFRISFNLSIRRLFKSMLSHGIEDIILTLRKENEKILKHWQNLQQVTPQKNKEKED